MLPWPWSMRLTSAAPGPSRKVTDNGFPRPDAPATRPGRRDRSVGLRGPDRLRWGGPERQSHRVACTVDVVTRIDRPTENTHFRAFIMLTSTSHRLGDCG